MIKKQLSLMIFFILITFTLAYPSSNRDIDNLSEIVKKYYATETENTDFGNILEGAIKDGVSKDLIKSIIIQGAQSERDFEEIKNYISKLDYLAQQNILPDHATNIILEGFAKDIDEDNIIIAINCNEEAWRFCRDISLKLFKKSTLKKIYRERLNIEKSILTLIDLNFEKENIPNLLKLSNNIEKSPGYFGTVLTVAIEIKSLGWKDHYITKLLKIAIEYNLSKERLLDLVNMISNEVEIGKNPEEITELISARLRSEYKETQKTTEVKREKTSGSLKSGKEGTKSNSGHIDNSSDGSSSHKR